MVTLRAVTYNVRALRDSEDASAAVLRRFHPDVVLLQETPRFLRWRARVAALARHADLLYVTGGGTTGGVAVLAGLRVDIEHVAEIRLSKRPKLHQRGLAAAVVTVGGRRLVVASTHLGLSADERPVHAAEVLGHLDTLATRYDVSGVVLAGDLNEVPGGPAWQAFAAAAFRDAYAEAPHGGELTFPAARPDKRIDAVLVRGELRVAAAGVPEEVDAATYAAATDHRPVVADLELPDAV